MYWMDLSGGDTAFYADLLGWQPSDGGVFTVDGQVVAGHGAPGRPGWNVHTVVDDVVAVCQAVGPHGGAVLAGPRPSGLGRLAVLADPAGAAFVVREPGRQAEVLHKPMTFSWAELCAPDAGPVRSFYRAVFGWDAVEVPMVMPAGEVGYTVFVTGRAERAGLLPAEGAFGPAAPPYWLAYIGAADADLLAARTGELGGEVLVEPFDVPRIGRIAILAGRCGEPFAVMQMPDSDRQG
jgi:predicted enzyme related to lactoylglutathione lyase